MKLWDREPSRITPGLDNRFKSYFLKPNPTIYSRRTWYRLFFDLRFNSKLYVSYTVVLYNIDIIANMDTKCVEITKRRSWQAARVPLCKR